MEFGKEKGGLILGKHFCVWAAPIGPKKTLKCEKNNSTLFLKSPRNTWPKNSS